MTAQQDGLLAQSGGHLVFLGDGGSGKTSLLRRLAGDDFDARQPCTTRLNIRRIGLTDRHNIRAFFNVWDLPGQVIFHWTKMLFSSRMPLFIITASGYDNRYRISRWVAAATSWVRKPSLLVIFTRGDERIPDIDFSYFHVTFPSVLSVMVTSAKTGYGIQELRDTIIDYALDLPSSSLKVPTQFEYLLRAVDVIKEPCLNRQSFAELHGVLGLTDQKILLEFIGDSGRFLVPRKAIEGTRELDPVLIDPGWLAEFADELMSIAVDRRGRLFQHELYRHLKQSLATDAMAVDIFLGTLCDAGVCARLTTGPCIWIFPYVLPKTFSTPEDDFEPRLAFRYPNFTEGLRELIIGRFARFVDDPDLIWRDRLVFTIFGIRVDVSFDRHIVVVSFSGDRSKISLAFELVRSECEVWNKLFDAIECHEGLWIQGVFYPLPFIRVSLSHEKHIMLLSGDILDIKNIAKYFGIVPVQDGAPNELQPSLQAKDVGDKCDVFASYNRSDSEVVCPMVHALTDRGHNVWIDSAIVPGQVWLDEMERGIRKAYLLLIFIGGLGLRSAFNGKLEWYL